MTIHEDPDAFKCQYTGCNSKPFTSKKALARHIKNIHKKQYALACKEPNCKYGTRDKQRLEDHMLKEHGKGDGVFCPHCKKPISSQGLSRHLQICSFNPELDINNDLIDKDTGLIYGLECSHCNRKFRTRKGLVGHRRLIHSSSSNHICEMCGVLFHTNTALEKHRSDIHPDSDFEVEEEEE